MLLCISQRVLGVCMESTEWWQELAVLGATLSTKGLPRLPGAPMGSPEFCIAAGGHIKKAADSACNLTSGSLPDHAHA